MDRKAFQILGAAARVLRQWLALRRRGSIGTLLAALVVVGGAVQVQAQGQGQGQGQDLRLAVSRGPVSLLIYVAQAEGYFAREGLAVRTIECASGRQCTQLLGEGQADVATASELMVTLNALEGVPNVIIATISSSTHHIKLVARRDAGIQSASDLAGKRVATVAGTSAQYFLDNWLVYNNIDPQGVTTVALRPDELLSALVRRQVDAIAIWEPIAGAALAALGPQALVLPSPRVYTQHFSLIANRNGIAQREPELLKLLRALDRAQRFIAERPAQARQILSARLAADVAEASLAEHDFRLGLEQPLVAVMEGQARWARQQGLVQFPRPTGNLLQSIEPSLLRKAVPGAVSLVY